MDLIARVRESFLESVTTKQSCVDAVAPPLAAAAERILTTLRRGGKVLSCGNGGSAADAQHFAAEMVNRFERQRRALAALALTTDTSILTSVANDGSFDEVFARQVEALAQEGDLLLAITTSGNSRNLCRAAETAHARGVGVIALTGRDGGAIAARLRKGDIEIRVASRSTARIQEVHLLIIHCLCELIDLRVSGES